MLGTADLHDKSVGDSSWRARCPECGKKISIPRLLAELPTPQIAERPPAFASCAAGMSSGAPSFRNPQPQTQSENAALAKAMPWAMSLFLHLGVAMILLFVGALVLRGNSEKDGIVNKGLDPAVLSAMGDDRPVQKGDKDGTSMTGQLKRPGSAEYTRKHSLDLVYGDGRPVGSFFREGTPGVLRWGDPRGTGPGAGTKGPFEPLPGKKRAAHIVFVIDRSGSMSDSFDALREALMNEVTGLKQLQDFHIIMFSSGVPVEMSSRKLVEASVSNVRQAGRFLEDVQPRGETDPLPALKRAFEVLAAQPEGTKLIQLLTDGEFPANQKVLELIDKMNAGRQVHVNTYLYGPHSQAAEKVLEEIAGKNKGQYKYYSNL
jgi:hypothetical protein